MIKNSNLVVDMDRAITRWKPIVERLGVTEATDPAKLRSLCEYAEMHSTSIAAGFGGVNENAMYANPANTQGMGAVINPGVNPIPGQNGSFGSGDLAQQMLPPSLKIAAHTPGLNLVPVINVNSNRIDYPFFDWQYDNVTTGQTDERGSVIKFRPTADADLADLKVWLRTAMAAYGVTETRGGVSKGLYFQLSGGALPAAVGGYDPTVEPATKTGVVKFEGFSRIDGMPILRFFTQQNSASSGGWGFNAALNTFPNTGDILTHLSAATIEAPANGGLTDNAIGAVNTVLPVSLNEDLVLDFTSSGKDGLMNRGEWDVAQAGKVGPEMRVATIQIGHVHVSGALRLSELGDFKRMYNIDLVEQTKAQLVNQIQQKISVEIVNKVKEFGLKNRASLASATGASLAALTAAGITDGKIYDVSVTAVSGALGGENYASLARKIWSTITKASFYIKTDGRIGTADYIVTSGGIAALFNDIAGYIINPFNAKFGEGQLQPAGTINGIKVYVDPYQRPEDLTIYLGRVGKADEPGIKFFAYMLAESVDVVSEKTMAPHLYMYSRFAVAEFGWFPEKQYMAIKVEDNNGILN